MSAGTVNLPAMMLAKAVAQSMAEQLRGIGCSLIPVGQNKRPTLASWKEYQTRAATAAELATWATAPRTTGFAVVCGAVSGGLEVLDFDVPNLYPKFLEALPAWAREVSFPTQQTGSGGYQLLYRRPTPGRNVELAHCKPFDEDGAVPEDAKLRVGIETRGEGGYAVIPGSLHPTGNRYRALNDWQDIPLISDEQAEELLALARSFDQRPDPVPAAAPEPARKAPATAPEGKKPLAGKKAAERAAERRKREVAAAVEGEVANVLDALEGGRNRALNVAAMSLGRFVPEELSEADVIGALAEAARKAGLEEGEILPTIKSGLQGARKKGRKPDPARYEDEEREKGEAISVGERKRGPKVSRAALPTFTKGTQEGTDEANAVILAASGLADQLRYTVGIGWFVYNSEEGRWQNDPEMIRAVPVAGAVLRTVVGQYFAEALEARVDKEELARIGKWASAVCNVGTVARALQAAAGKPEFLTDAAAWDADPGLLNCKNGVLNLKTGVLAEHAPRYLMTWQAGAAYDPVAAHPYVDQLVDLLRRDGRHDFLQRVAGSGMYGAAPNETITVLEGPGGTGKGTLTDGVLATLGDYAGTIEIQLLLHNPHGESGTGPKPELLMLRGKRLIVAGEPEQGVRFNAGRVKGMSGNDPITARNMRSPAMVTFTPVFKLWIHTNYPIGAAHDDTGLQRRIKVVPFRAKPEKADLAFKATLKSDPVARSALLNWLLEGCRAWLASGYDLGESEAVAQATGGYWKAQNPYEKFAEKCLEFGDRYELQSGRLKSLFEEWAEENGARLGRHLKMADLYAYLQERGCEPGRTKQGRFWFGVTEAVTPVTEVTPIPPVNTALAYSLEVNRGNDVTSVTSVTEPRDDVAGWEGDEL